MPDARFFRTAGPYSATDIAALIGAEIGGGDPTVVLVDVAPLESAGPGYLTFLTNPKYFRALQASGASAIILHPNLVAKAPAGATLLLSPKPYLAFARAAQAFHPPDPAVQGIAASAIIDPSAVIGAGTSIGPNVVIEERVEIGPGCRIGPNTVIAAGVVIGAEVRIASNVTISHCLMGDRVLIHPGVRIGQDGFGFAPDPPSGHVKIPQLGRVLIGDGVEIGANCTVDRGSGPDTVIGAGTMIDNLVHIGHNVVLGRGCVLAGQAGVAGSAKVGDFVMIGGQVGLGGHLTVGDGAKIGGKSGVMRDVPAGAAVGGIPAVPMMQWHRQTTILDRLANKKDK